MSMETITKSTLYELANDVIKKLGEITDPFDMPTLVFNNTKLAQWFKAYFLKTQDGVLMNVEFETVSNFVNRLINPDGKYAILNVPSFRDYIIKALIDLDIESENIDENEKKILKYIYSDYNNKQLNGIHLYEFATRLSNIFLNMEFDGEEIGSANGSAWQKVVYAKTLKLAEEDDCYTPKAMFDKGLYKETKSSTPVYIIDNSYLTNLYKDIFNECGADVTLFEIEKNENSFVKNSVDGQTLRLASAPSILREVEWLHTDICKRLENDKGLKVNDFVVYAPQISDYANSIRRVFEKNGTSFFELPFKIAGESKEKTSIVSILNLLYEIANKGFFTRYDLQKFLYNETIMRINDFTREEAETMMDAVLRTNTYRNGDGVENWAYLKNRLLTALLVDYTGEMDSLVKLGDKECLPFASINLNKALMNKLIDIIDDLTAWADVFACNDGADLGMLSFNKEGIEKVEEKLDALLSRENADQEEKNYMYADVRAELENIEKMFDPIPAITLLRLLCDAPNRYSSCPADVFSGGATFLNLERDNIVKARYVYILGMSSANFPRVEERSEIDYSDHELSQDFDKKSIDSLLSQCENITFSYVSEDLKSGEEFYPSSLVPFVDDDNVFSISIDEKRDYAELYTKRELMRRQYNDMINGVEKALESEAESADNKECATDACNEELPDNGGLNSSNGAKIVITTRDIKKFLENTMVYKYKKILREDKDDDEAQKKEYEPIDLKGLDSHSVVKEMILAGLDLPENRILEIINDADDYDENLFKKMQIENRLPKSDIAEFYFKVDYRNEALPVIKFIRGYEEEGGKSRIFDEKWSNDLGSKTVDIGSFIIEINTDVYYYEIEKYDTEDDTYKIELSFVEAEKFDDKPKKYLGKYACALAYVASKIREDKNKIYEVKLYTGEEKKQEFEITPEGAKTCLTSICGCMTKLAEIKYMDIIIINKGNSFESIDKLKDNVYGQHGALEHFADKEMLDHRIDFGYSEEDFMDEFDRERNKISEMILYYNK